MIRLKQIENQKEAELYDLFTLNNHIAIVDESVILNAMKVANVKFFGAIDSEDQNALCEFYGVIFNPARNHGENKWYVENNLKNY